MGDINVRVGNKNTGIEEFMASKNEEVKNDNGTRIVQLSAENNLIIAKFKHKDIHKYTRTQPSKNGTSIIDYFLISRNKWKTVKNVKVTRQVESGNREKNKQR